MIDYSALLYNTTEQAHFLKNLDLTQDEFEFIDTARKDIRRIIKESLPEVLKSKGIKGEMREPRFYIQGSRSYRTLNRPAIVPPQQSDIDDGVYLPLTIVKEEEKPDEAIELFFDSVNEVLKPLVHEKGWSLVYKSTCLRVVIAPYAHIDLPLYAIPDDQFLLLKKAMENRGYNSLGECALDSAALTWATLPSDKVLLAHRSSGWIKSDPKRMKTWFQCQVEDKGEQLRRVIRYLKAFRDNSWCNGGPSSILLMAAACEIFESHDRRDDLALASVVDKISDVFRAGVASPIDDTVSLTDALDEDELMEAIEKFNALSNKISEISQSKNENYICDELVAIFGNHFPYAPELVKFLPNDLPSEIDKHEPEKGPAEKILRTKAGVY